MNMRKLACVWLVLLSQAIKADEVDLVQTNPWIEEIVLSNIDNTQQYDAVQTEWVISREDFAEGVVIHPSVNIDTKSIQIWADGHLLATQNSAELTLQNGTLVTLDTGIHEIRIVPFSLPNGAGSAGVAKVLNLLIADTLHTSTGLEQFHSVNTELGGCPDYSTLPGTVHLKPGDDIQALIDKPENMAFFFTGSEQYYRLSKPLVPRAGQVFYGQLKQEGGRCVSSSVLAGSFAMPTEAFEAHPSSQPEYWVYHYNHEEEIGDTGETGAYVFRNEQFNAQQGKWPRSVVNWACEYKDGNEPEDDNVTPDSAFQNPRCSDPKAIFMNNNRLMHVDSLVALRSGAFYHDYANRKIYLKDNPSNQRIEFAFNYAAAVATDAPGNIKKYPDEMVWKAIEEGNKRRSEAKNSGSRLTADKWNIAYLYNGNTNVGFHGLVFRHFSASNHYAALPAGDARKGWKLSHNIFEFNSGAAVQMGPQWQVNNNIFRFNGQYGVLGRDAHFAELKQNEISFNNVAKVCNTKGARNLGDGSIERDGDCPAAGGTKFSHSLNVDFVQNCSIGNTGPGFWTDIANGNIDYLHNLAARNSRAGIYHEISFNANIHHNQLLFNGANQLYLNDSRNLSVLNNVMAGSYDHVFVDNLLRNMAKKDTYLIPAAVQFTKRGRGASSFGTVDNTPGSEQVTYADTDKVSEMLLNNITFKHNRIVTDDNRLMLLGFTVKAHRDIDKSTAAIAFAESVFSRAQTLLDSFTSDSNRFENQQGGTQMFRFFKNELSNNKTFFTFDGYRTLTELKLGTFEFNAPLDEHGNVTGPNVGLNWAMDNKSDFISQAEPFKPGAFLYRCDNWFESL